MVFISGFLYYRDTTQTILILDRGVRSIFFSVWPEKSYVKLFDFPIFQF